MRHEVDDGLSPFLSSGEEDEDEVSRRELGRLVACRYWGRGRFGRALRAGVREERLSRPRRGVYGPPD